MNWWCMGVFDLHAVEGLAVGLVGLAADVVGDAGRGHQVALVGGVDEHLAAVGLARFHRDRDETPAVLADAVLPIEPLAEDDRDFVFAEEIVEDGLGDVRLEGPGRVLAAVVAWPLEIRALLVFPVFLVLVVAADAAVEIARDAADGLLVADVGGAQSAGGHAAQVLARLDQHDGLAHAGRLDRRRNAARGAAVDDQVIATLWPHAEERRGGRTAARTKPGGLAWGSHLRNRDWGTPRPLIVAPSPPNASRCSLRLPVSLVRTNELTLERYGYFRSMKGAGGAIYQATIRRNRSWNGVDGVTFG